VALGKSNLSGDAYMEESVRISGEMIAFVAKFGAAGAGSEQPRAEGGEAMLDFYYTFKKPEGWINPGNPSQTWDEWTRAQGIPTTRGWKVFGTPSQTPSSAIDQGAQAGAKGAALDERALFDKAFLSCNGFHTQAELDLEWNSNGGLAAAMFREGFRAALTQQAAPEAPSRDAGQEDASTQTVSSIEDYAQFHILHGAWLGLRDYYQADEPPEVAEAWRKFIAYIDGRTAGTAGGGK
jgi:hypothetical protein